MSSRTVGGEMDKTDYKVASSEVKIKREDVIAKGTMAYIENIKAVAEEMNRQRAKYFFDKMKEVTEKTGNIVNGKGQPMNFDLFLETIKKMWIDFDDAGNPILPTIVVSPELGARLNKMLPEWERNDEYRKAFDEVIKTKRKEWNDRESNRKLVD